MDMYNVGQKLCKKDKFGQITELYRIVSRKDKDFYKVTPVIGDKLLIDKYKTDEYIPLEIHCKMFFEVCTLKNGEKELCISIYCPYEAMNYPYYTSRLNIDNPMDNKKFGKFLCKDEFENDSSMRQYKRAYDLMMYDIAHKDYAFSVDLYLNDPLKNIVSFVKLDPKVCDTLISICDSRGLEYDNIDQAIKIALQNILFMYWFHYNFRVINVLFEVKDGAQLRPGDLFALEAIVQDRIVDYTIVEYYHDILLYKAKGNFFFIQDRNDRTFIVKYVGMDDLPGLHVF